MARVPRFHGLMLVRDEGDIIQQCIEHWLTWCDRLHVLDTGSTDGTWDLVEQAHRLDARVVPFRKALVAYHAGLRAWMFEHARREMEPGDWVLRADADEFYDVPPPSFVKRLAPYESRIDLQWYFFRLTDRDVAAWNEGRETVEDRRRPIQDRRRFFTVPTYSEPRAFRYRRHMKWDLSCSAPYNMGITAAQRIPIRHYPHRDPDQMERRARLRNQMFRLGGSGGHWNIKDWRSDVLYLDGRPGDVGRDGGLAEVDGLTGRALEWRPGTKLPVVGPSPVDHVAKKRLAYSVLVPLLDRVRRGSPAGYEPPPLEPPAGT